MNTINTNTEKTGLLTRIEHKFNIYEQITERVCKMLEQGVAPWTKPWTVNRGMPKNLISKKCYRGINTWLLHACQYESPFWLTMNQANELGARIRKGEKACPVVFWRQVDIKDKETGEDTKVPFMRFYYVWNTAQIDGLKNQPAIEAQPTTAPAQVIAGYPNAPQIRHGMAAAFYDPSQDFVGMPNPDNFTHEADYYATVFHELVHSTGHPSRLDRLTKGTFGSESYSKEELTAEMGSAFLCGVAGVERQLEQSAAYLKGWMSALKQDNKLIIQAAAAAQKAADHILGTKMTE